MSETWHKIDYKYVLVLYVLSMGCYLKGTTAEVILFYALGIVKSKWDSTEFY